jgi:hypothetical protein
VGVYRSVAKILGERGYRGEWYHKHSFGLFTKEFRTRDALRKEVERFSGVSLKSLLGDARRRTRA